MIGFDEIEFASLTDVGSARSHNQDSFAICRPATWSNGDSGATCFLVADGMGAHAVGELASKLAADNIPHIYSKHAQEGPVPALRKAFVETNIRASTPAASRTASSRAWAPPARPCCSGPKAPGSATSATAGPTAVRDGNIEQLSFDHSLVWELARRQNRAPRRA